MRRFCALLNKFRVKHHSTRDLLQRAILGAALELGFQPLTEIPEVPRCDDLYLALEPAAIPNDPLPGTLLLYNLEPLPTPLMGTYLASWGPRYNYEAVRSALKPVGRVDGILDYCESTTRFLLEQGHRAAFCPPGYHPSLEVPSDVKPFSPGVYILGMNRKDRRSKIALRIGAKFIYTRTDIGNRDRLLRTRGIHVNIHREADIQTFGGMKLIQMYLANKRFLITEPHWWSPLNNHEHYLEFAEDKMDNAIKYWSQPRRAKERRKIAACGYEFVKERLHQTPWLKRALEVLEVM